jgi:hypothetical protein
MVPPASTNVAQNGPQDQSYHNSPHGPSVLGSSMNGFGSVPQGFYPMHIPVN